MKRLTHLLRDNQIGEWCKRAAWLVACFGALQIVLFLLAKYAFLPNQAAAIFGTASDLTLTLQTVIGYLTNTVFFFFLLYTAGGLANHFLGTAEDTLPEEEEAEEEEPSLIDKRQFKLPD